MTAAVTRLVHLGPPSDALAGTKFERGKHEGRKASAIANY